MAITLDEKIRAFKEAGLDFQVTLLEQEKTIKELVNMKFKPITIEEIRVKICSKPYKEKMLYIKFFGFYLFHDTNLCLRYHNGKHIKEKYVDSFPKLDVKNLDAWDDPLPYGAALAVKEAKEQNITDFIIYFPSTEKGYLKRHDPVIVGFYGRTHKEKTCLNSYSYCSATAHTHIEIDRQGVMVEVFSWDDSKIYD